MVVQALIKMKRLEKFIIAFYIFWNVSYIAVIIYRSSDEKDNIKQYLDLAYLIIGLIVFVMNVYLVNYFYKMSQFYIECLSKTNLISLKRTKAFIISVIIIILVCSFDENVFESGTWATDIWVHIISDHKVELGTIVFN